MLLMCAAAAVSHFVAYETDEMIIDDPGAIAVNYRWAQYGVHQKHIPQYHTGVKCFDTPAE
jgi:hypothetical protein